MKLTSPNYYNYPPIEIYSTQNPNDTSIVARHLRFGKSLQYTLSTYPVQNIPMDYDKLTSFNKNDLHDFKEYNSYTTTGYMWFWSQSISSQNTMFGSSGLFDFNSSRFIFKQEYANTILSPDGKYVFTTDYNMNAGVTLYEVSDTGMRIIGQLPRNVYSLKIWIPCEDHKLLLLIGNQTDYNASATENTIEIRDAQTMKLDIDFKVRYGHLSGIDFKTGQLAIWDVFPNSDDKRKLYIYNYNNGQLEKEINLAPRFDVITSYRSHILSGNGFDVDYSTLSAPFMKRTSLCI